MAEDKRFCGRRLVTFACKGMISDIITEMGSNKHNCPIASTASTQPGTQWAPPASRRYAKLREQAVGTRDERRINLLN
ncbi:hypothetical protein EYF80_058271 [Liparis tanakae]|uniref:Uncharacterized protein n=1 Tax=Liparis tanakae TaxID=230148 RepID=A0A4Z2ERP1_9TELE|nr:hypothetical protein EYF80_058271 [Liparis tanakae]